MVGTDISLVGDSERDFLPILQRYERAAEPRGSMLQVVAKSAPAPHTLDRIELPASQPPIVSCGDKFPRIRLRPHIISRLEAAPRVSAALHVVVAEPRHYINDINVHHPRHRAGW